MSSPRDWQIYTGQASPPPPPLSGKWTVFVDSAGKIYLVQSDASQVEVRKGSLVRHEEFLPAAAATTVTLAAAAAVVLVVARNGVVQSVAAGHYSASGATLTFTTAFDGTERVVVGYEV